MTQSGSAFSSSGACAATLQPARYFLVFLIETGVSSEIACHQSNSDSSLMRGVHSHAVKNIQGALNALLPAEKHNIALNAGVVVDNGFEIFGK